MNNLGFSIDNLHIGDVRIKGQGETLRVGDDNGGDGYVLPTVKGTVGQILTMNADNSTSFQDIPSSTERICVNRCFESNQSYNFGSGSGWVNLFKNENDAIGTNGAKTIGSRIIPGSDIQADSFTVLHAQIKNRVENASAGTDNITQFRFRIETGGVVSTIEWEQMNYGGLSLPFPGVQTNVECWVYITKNTVDDTSLFLNFISTRQTNEASTTAPVGTNQEKLFYSHNNIKLGSQTGNIIPVTSVPTDNKTTWILTGYTPGDSIELNIQSNKTANSPNQIYSNLAVGTIDTYVAKTLAGGAGGGGTSDHLLLSNLNGGALFDGGHANMFLINGAKPMTGNIDMNSNDIINCSDILGQGVNRINLNPPGQMDFLSTIAQIVGTSSVFLASNNVIVNRINSIDKLLLNASGVRVLNGNLDLQTNNIINVATVGGANGDLDFTLTETHLNSNNDLHLESASNFNTEVRIQGTGEFKVLHGGGDRFVVGNNLITASRNIDMNSNNIREVNEISSTTNNNTIKFDVGPTNELQLASQHTRIGDFSISGNSLYIDSNVAQLSGTSSVDLSASKINITGPLDMNNNDIINANKLTMNNTLAEHPIIVYLPALAADFSATPYNNVLVTINASGNIRPIGTTDPDSTAVIGVTDEIITTDGLKRVQIGGICTFTPAPGQTINAGTNFERSNTGPALNGTVMLATGVGTCGIALTSGTGDATGSVKILGLWTKNEHF